MLFSFSSESIIIGSSTSSSSIIFLAFFLLFVAGFGDSVFVDVLRGLFWVGVSTFFFTGFSGVLLGSVCLSCFFSSKESVFSDVVSLFFEFWTEEKKDLKINY